MEGNTGDYGRPTRVERLDSSGSLASQVSRSSRHLYRKGSISSHSLHSYSDGDGVVLQPLTAGDHAVANGAIGSGRKRTPSGQSIRSRIASRAEYHEDLKTDLSQKITSSLLFASFLIMFGSSFLFGYNIGVLNQPVDLIKQFYNETYTERNGEFDASYLTLLWSLTTAMFLPGGMIGAYTAGFLADKMGRKKAVMFSHIFAVLGGVVSCLCVKAKAPELLMTGRFITGINCGFATQLAPMYLAEITPVKYRGAFGTGHQLFITIGIFAGSVFGLREILGTVNGWPYLLLINAIPAILTGILLPFIHESPRYLMIIRKDRKAAEKALQWYKQCHDVVAELEEMETESDDKDLSTDDESYTMMKLLRTQELHMPLLIAVMLQVIQQLSGINAVFFYSKGIYENSGVSDEHIQYAVVGTNFVNVFMTIIAVNVMDKWGRRPLLLYPMVAMIFILGAITVSLNLQESVDWMSYISVCCVIGYVICFAVGLGPIPTMIGAELFRQGPRPRAMSLAGLANWIFTFIVAMSFESVQEIATTYTFLIFLVLMIVFTIFVYFKVPETKNKTFEEIASLWAPGGKIEVEEIMEDVFHEKTTGEGLHETDKMLPDAERKHRNGSVTSDHGNGNPPSYDDVKVKMPEEKRALTRSAENIHTSEA